MNEQFKKINNYRFNSVECCTNCKYVTPSFEFIIAHKNMPMICKLVAKKYGSQNAWVWYADRCNRYERNKKFRSE